MTRTIMNSEIKTNIKIVYSLHLQSIFVWLQKTILKKSGKYKIVNYGIFHV